MSEEQLEGILAGVPHDRRTFVKRIVAGTAFAVPVVASFGMKPAFAGKGALTPNQDVPTCFEFPNQQTYVNSIYFHLANLHNRANELKLGNVHVSADKAINALQACDFATVRAHTLTASNQIAAALAKGKISAEDAQSLQGSAEAVVEIIDGHQL